MIKRKIFKRLEKMHEDGGKYALLVDGARQVGKTYIIREFAKTHYESFIEINFIRMKGAREIFENVEDEHDILVKLSTLSKGRLKKGSTLVFFDEVQKCPEAVTYIKFLVEEGSCHYVLSGSLLGVELKRKKVSFPVGKDEQLKLYPLDFYEFTQALGGGNYLEMLQEFDPFREIPSYIAEPMLRYLKLYYIIGGMPEAVRTYVETEDLTQVDTVLDRIIRDLHNDFAHHAEPKDIVRIGWIWDSVPKQLAKDNNKFVFSHVREGTRARDLEDALQWLVDAGLVYRLEMVSAPQIPLSSCSDATFFKTYGADLGLLRRNAGVGYRTVLTEPEGYASFKGAFTENYCMTELTTLGIRPYYWRSGNSAEVDFLLEDSLNRIMPLEVKSADNTRAKSLATYCRQYKPELAFKVSAKNIGDNQKGDTHEIRLPLYLLWRLPVYIGQ